MHKHIRVFFILLLLTFAAASTQAAPLNRPTQNLAPTYRIFATREGLVGLQTANGHIIQERDHFVALPSWQVLSSYQGYEYQVRITYQGRTTVVPVWDVGPWNTDDDYWSPNRSLFPDLPIGLPQAEAAYFDGHNGGLDQFGRVVNNPNGIDIADGTFWDSLGMTNNDWVNVSFLWLGEDPGPGAAVQAPIPPPPDAAVPAPPPPPAQPPADDGEPGAPPPAAPAPPAEPTAQPLDNPLVEAGAIAVDDGDPGFDGGGFAWENAVCGLNGTHTWTYAQDSSQQYAAWEPGIADGVYELSVYVPNCGVPIDTTRTARYTVFHDGGTDTILVNQAAWAGQWVPLGGYHFGKATPPRVELSASTSDAGSAIHFDALAWRELPDQAPPESQIVQITREANGYRVEWSGQDDLSGISSYDVQVRRLPSGQWRMWGERLQETSGWFGPDEGKHFAFRVRARDYTGNQEAWPPDENGDMDTTQAAPAP